MASSLATGIPSASKYTCPCLNVTIFARQGINSHTLVPVDPRDFTDINATHLSQKIFEGSTRVAEIEIDVGGIRSVSAQCKEVMTDGRTGRRDEMFSRTSLKGRLISFNK